MLIVCSLLSSQSINEQIQALEEATPEKRVELMNHIKEQLIIMNQDERMETIDLLKSQLHNENGVAEERHQELSQNNHLNEEHELHEHQLHQHHTNTEYIEENRDEEPEPLEPSHHNEMER
jgi:hypothetical protein